MIMAQERKLLDAIGRQAGERRHELDPAILERVLRRYPTITPEQKEAVLHLTEGVPLRLLSGTAGTGKGYVLTACHDIWKEEGRHVVGVAEAGRTAKRLQRDTGIPSDTLAMTLIRLGRGDLRLSEKSVVVVDEAGMLGTAPLAKLLACVEKAKSTLILAGDSFQLQPVQAGPPSRSRRTSSARRRSSTRSSARKSGGWREAVHDFKAGRSQEALAKFIEHGAFVVTETRRDAFARCVEQWRGDGGVDHPEKAVMIAGTNGDVRELNRLAQAVRIRAGWFDPEKKLHADGVLLHVGDKVVFRHPNRRYDLLNGDAGTVLAVDPERQRLTVRLDRDERELTVNISKKAKLYNEKHVQLSYAQTTHLLQGATVEHCTVLLGGPNMDLPMNSPGWCAAWGNCAEAVSGSRVGRRPQSPLAPSIANRCRRMRFLSVVRGHRPVAPWRPPRSTRLLRGQWTEFEAHRRRLPLQRLQHIGLHLGLVLFHRLRDVLLAVLEHPVDQTRQLVRRRLDGSESADPAADATVEQAQRRHGLAQRPRTHPQRDGHGVGALAVAAAFLRLVALILRRTQP